MARNGERIIADDAASGSYRTIETVGFGLVSRHPSYLGSYAIELCIRSPFFLFLFFFSSTGDPHALSRVSCVSDNTSMHDACADLNMAHEYDRAWCPLHLERGWLLVFG